MIFLLFKNNIIELNNKIRTIKNGDFSTIAEVNYENIKDNIDIKFFQTFNLIKKQIDTIQEHIKKIS